MTAENVTNIYKLVKAVMDTTLRIYSGRSGKEKGIKQWLAMNLFDMTRIMMWSAGCPNIDHSTQKSYFLSMGSIDQTCVCTNPRMEAVITYKTTNPSCLTSDSRQIKAWERTDFKQMHICRAVLFVIKSESLLLHRMTWFFSLMELCFC